MDNTTILLVEDNSNDELLMLRALKKNEIGAAVFIARDGVEALDFLFCTNAHADRDPDDLPQLVLLDIKLPGIDGLEVLRRIRAEERTRRVPVVLLSSFNDEREMITGYKNGASSYLRKPVDYTQFVEFVRQLGAYWRILNKAPLA